MYEKIICGMILIGLAGCSVTDIRRRKVSVLLLMGTMAVILVLQGLNGTMDVELLLGVAVVGAVFCGISILTGGQIGMGDGFLFMMTGSGLGVFGNLQLIFLSFVGTFLAAVYLVGIRRKGKNMRIPLSPFVLAGSVLLICQNFLNGG